MREVPSASQDKLVPDQELLDVLSQLFKAFHDSELRQEFKSFSDLQTTSAGTSQHGYRQVMQEVLGFNVNKSPSSVSGTGVFVEGGCAPQGSLLALYPGMYYLQGGGGGVGVLLTAKYKIIIMIGYCMCQRSLRVRILG